MKNSIPERFFFQARDTDCVGRRESTQGLTGHYLATGSEVGLSKELNTSSLPAQALPRAFRPSQQFPLINDSFAIVHGIWALDGGGGQNGEGPSTFQAIVFIDSIPEGWTRRRGCMILPEGL